VSLGRRTDSPVPEVTAGRQLVGPVGAQGLLGPTADVAIHSPGSVSPLGQNTRPEVRQSKESHREAASSLLSAYGAHIT